MIKFNKNADVFNFISNERKENVIKNLPEAWFCQQNGIYINSVYNKGMMLQILIVLSYFAFVYIICKISKHVFVVCTCLVPHVVNK